MRLVVLAVGLVKERPMRALIDEYLARIRRYLPCDEIELKTDERLGAAVSKASSEGAVVALEVDGRALDSVAFARQLEKFGCRGKGVVTFVIGGADGIPPAISKSADARITLSPLTFPHRLARLVLCEQLYRAMTILRGEPYGH